jgi:hypothetical protein
MTDGIGNVVYVPCVAALGGLRFGYDSAVINRAVGAIGSHFHAQQRIRSYDLRGPILQLRDALRRQGE